MFIYKYLQQISICYLNAPKLTITKSEIDVPLWKYDAITIFYI